MNNAIRVRWHHLITLKDLATTCPKNRVISLQNFKYQSPRGVIFPNYSKESSERISSIIDDIVLKNLNIVPTFNSDFFCKNCTGYNGRGCDYYNEKDLRKTDTLTARDMFKHSRLGESAPFRRVLGCSIPNIHSFYP